MEADRKYVPRFEVIPARFVRTKVWWFLVVSLALVPSKRFVVLFLPRASVRSSIENPVTGLEKWIVISFGPAVTQSRKEAADLGDDEVVLSSWAA